MEKIKKEDVMNEFHIALKNLMEVYNKIDPAANTTTKNNIFMMIDKLSKAYGIIQGNITSEK